MHFEIGFDVVCFEQEDDIGGLWRFTASDTHSSVCKSTVINTSKEMMSFSDFPAPREFPVYMPNTKVMEYFQMYAKRFDLLKHIKFNTSVKSVKRTDDHDLTGRWEITYYPHGKEIVGQKSEIVDFLFVCTGHHWMKNVPKFEGMDDFKGDVIHSKQYKDFKGFENKNVLVVGRKTFCCFIKIKYGWFDAGCPLQLEKLENQPFQPLTGKAGEPSAFSCFGSKNWNFIYA